MDQSVMVFAGTAARSSAIGTALSEGMVSYLSDSNALQFYDGAAWQPVASAAGSGNAIINGAFDIWQRGTSFTQAYFAAGTTYVADRFTMLYNANPTAVTISQQTFTPGAAPVAGYEGTFFYRSTLTTIGSTTIWGTQQRIEDVRTFAGQTATISFWAKADSARNVTIELVQNFGSGGSADVTVTSTVQAITSSWARYTATVSVPSISGKTVGTNSSLRLTFLQACASGSVLDLWGIQFESGSTATAFRRNGENIAAELAACQRYFLSQAAGSICYNSNGVGGSMMFKQTMRTSPTMSVPLGLRNTSTGVYSTTATTLFGNDTGGFYYVYAAGSWSPGLSTGMSYDFAFTANAEL
jgi:hypothetical protein